MAAEVMHSHVVSVSRVSEKSNYMPNFGIFIYLCGIAQSGRDYWNLNNKIA